MRQVFTILFLLSFISLNAQHVWTSSQESDVPAKNLDTRYIVPDKFGTYKLDMDLMIQKLSKAPLEDFQKKNQKTVSLEIPLPEGEVIIMEFVESPCMSPVLSQKFPDIKSYLGYNPENRSEIARIDYGPMGFHAAINTRKGSVYIDPYYTFPDEYYMSYYVKDHTEVANANPGTCGYKDYEQVINQEIEQYAQPESEENIRYKSEPVIRNTYRLALACTGSWGSIWGTKENVMSRFNTAVNRLNIIFENEVSTHLELIDDNDELIFFRENEPYSEPGLGGETLRENTSVINNAVGSNSYDIGHVITVRCTDGVAGIAFGGSVCRGDKGGGVSCIGTSDVSFFMIQTGAHEVGHQFSGGHSWNNCPGNDGQRSPSTSWEPGSGSTILSYSGLCGNNNVTGPNDAYFHVGNVGQFYDFIEATSCGLKEISDNNTPDLFVDIPDDLVIPISTPFELDGRAEDPDGDVLTYNWEQMDIGPAATLGQPSGNSPLFRSLEPDDETLRIFPQLGNILSGIGNPREVLPTYSRDLTFRFTVRDNHPGVGTTVWEEVEFRSSDTAGPFRITSPNGITFQEVGAQFEVEWDVANTDNDIINCETVDIFLSTNGGGDFDIVLAEGVPNDGTHTITIPNNITNAGRIKVKASNNIFFHIGRGEVIIRAPSTPGFYIDLAQNDLDVCLPENASVDIIGTTFQDFENDVTLDIISGLPDNATYEFTNNPVPAGQETTLNIDLSNVSESSLNDIVIQATATDADTVEQALLLEVTATDMSDLSLMNPASGTEGINGTPGFEWTPSINAESYTLEISTSPEFGPTNTFIQDNIKETEFIPQILLDNSELFYWRVSGVNKCVEMFESEIFTFGTLSLNCVTYSANDLPKNISQSGTSSVSSTIQVFEQGEIADVNVETINGVHGRSRDLTAVLINPAGEEIELFSDQCSGANFNLGFDNESPIDFVCPLNAGRTMKLEEGSLLGFNQGNTEGAWELRLEDNRSGEGGRLDEFVLELCSNSTFDKPFLVNNNVLEVPTGAGDRIFNDLLLSQDNNNSADELLYTIVVETSKGTLFMNGEPMTVGSRFTQADIDNQALRYVHEGTEDETDRFVFTVIDGEGGFIDLTEFLINTDMNFTSATDEIGLDDQFRVFPNPVSNTLHIYNKETSGQKWQLQMYNLEGQVVHTDIVDQRLSIDTRTINSGLYLLHLSDGTTYYTYKVNVVK